jgi:hypothetical protein
MPKLSRSPIETDFSVDAIVADFTVLHFRGHFFDVDGTNIPKRFGRFIHRSLRGCSQPFGDCESSSITFTTLAVMKIRLLLFIADRQCIACFCESFCLAGGQQSRPTA